MCPSSHWIRWIEDRRWISQVIATENEQYFDINIQYTCTNGLLILIKRGSHCTELTDLSANDPISFFSFWLFITFVAHTKHGKLISFGILPFEGSNWFLRNSIGSIGRCETLQFNWKPMEVNIDMLRRLNSYCQLFISGTFRNSIGNSVTFPNSSCWSGKI